MIYIIVYNIFFLSDHSYHLRMLTLSEGRLFLSEKKLANNSNFHIEIPISSSEVWNPVVFNVLEILHKNSSGDVHVYFNNNKGQLAFTVLYQFATLIISAYYHVSLDKGIQIMKASDQQACFSLSGKGLIFLDEVALSLMRSNVYLLMKAYDEKYQPSEWVKEFSQKKIFLDCAKKTVCYTKDLRHDMVNTVLYQRQSVNIGMEAQDDWVYQTGPANASSEFNIDYRMKDKFFFSSNASGYSLISEELLRRRHPINTNQGTASFYGRDIYLNAIVVGDVLALENLPPNLSVYCYTPLRPDPERSEEYYIHIMNSVGIALDNERQPDYKTLVLSNKNEVIMLRPGGYEVMFETIRGAYDCLFRCAKDLGLTKIAVCHLGGNNFANFYPGEKDKYLKEIWIPAFNESYKKHGTFLTKLYVLNGNNDHVDKLNEILKTNIVHNLGKIPGIFTADTKYNDVLFQNAWDPHSVAGNGNEKDNSLDGYFGRSTAISVLTFPSTNMFIKTCLVRQDHTFLSLLHIH